LGFNVGVEIGQLLAVLAAAALLKIVATIASVARQRSDAPAAAARQRSGAPAAVASAMLLAAGLAWFLTRAAAVE
jgi:hypothetical protein